MVIRLNVCRNFIYQKYYKSSHSVEESIDKIFIYINSEPIDVRCYLINAYDLDDMFFHPVKF